MKVLAIDPGTLMSGWVSLYSGDNEIEDAGEEGNERVLERIGDADIVLIESMAFQGKMAGGEVIETCIWIGRFQQSALDSAKRLSDKTQAVWLCPRRRVLQALQCENDRQVKELMVEIYGPPRTKRLVTPTSKSGKPLKEKLTTVPGPTHMVSGHAWQALGLYHAWRQTRSGPGQ